MSNKIITTLNDFIKKYHLYAFKDVAIFMIILLFFHFLWKTFYHDVLMLQFFKDSEFWLARKVFISSAWILEVFNVNVTTFDELTIGEVLRRNVIYYAEGQWICLCEPKLLRFKTILSVGIFNDIVPWSLETKIVVYTYWDL